MLRFGKIKVAKKELYRAKQPIKISDVNVDNIVISKIPLKKNNSKHMIGYLNDVK